MRVAQRNRRSPPKSNSASATAEAAAAGHPDGGSAATKGAAVPTGRTTSRSRLKKPQPVLHDLLRGLRAGDLECVLLTVAMAAEENRMPSADPDEAARILAFLARLAEQDAALPPGPSARTGQPLDEDGPRS